MRLGPGLYAVVREILPEEQLRFQASLGIRLDETEATAFAFACRKGRSSPRDVRAVTGLVGADARAALERLAVQGLVSPLEGAETPVFVVAEHLRGRLGPTDQVSDQADVGPPDLITDQAGARQDDLSTAQVGHPPADLSTAQVPSRQEDLSTTYAHCDVPRSLTEIMNALGVAGRGYFKRRHLDPLLRGGVLRMTHLEQPRHPGQAYVLTEAGVALKSRRVKEDAGTGNGGRTNGPQQAG